jgi:hypothetical protein
MEKGDVTHFKGGDVDQGAQFQAHFCIIAMARFCIFRDFERNITGSL